MCHQLKADDARQIAKRVAASHSLGVTNRFSMIDNLSMYPDPFLMGQTSIAKRQHQKISPTAGIAEGDACSGVLVFVSLLAIMCHQLKADDFQHKPISEIINNGIPLFNTTHEGWGQGIFSWHHL